LKNILILGSSGFIGKSLFEHLNKFYSKKIKSISLVQRTKKKFNFDNKNFSIKINLFIKDFRKIKKLPKCDTIIYCIRSKQIKESLILFSHFKSLIKNKKKIKIIFLSSGAVYGVNKKKEKLKETKRIDIDKINLLKGYKKQYAKQKLLLENKFYKLSKLGFSISVARCFTFYGENILGTKLYIAKIINLMKSKKNTLKMKNLKHIYRSYMHSFDLCEWLISILINSDKKFQIYNVGSDQAINLNNLTKKISKKFEKKIIINTSKFDKEIEYYIPSTKKVLKKLKLKTKFDLNKIISNLS
jgi:nucleoside-diphosphate-sugar epimerase